MTASTNCTNGESESHECSNGAAHKSHKPTTNTPEHVADLGPVLQNARKRFRSTPCHYIDAETENPPHHLSYLTSTHEWSVALVGYAMFATAAGTSVAFDGTNTASHSGKDV